MNSTLATSLDSDTSHSNSPDSNSSTFVTTWLSVRIWHGRTTADLKAMGIQLTGELKGNFIEAILPAGWQVIHSEVSPYQRRVIDEQCNIRIRLYDQPGSAGGGTEMCIEE